MRIPLLSDWWRRSERVTPEAFKLSVVLVTYNHAAFIDAALDSLLMQDFAAPLEVIVADDASSDDTRAIVARRLEAAGRLPFRFLDSSRNLGITRNYQRAFAACRSDYAAILEGDDWWTAPDRLTRMVGFLDAHPECAICAANYEIVSSSAAPGAERVFRVPPDDGVSLHTPANLVVDNVPGNFSSCMYRVSALRTLPPALFDLVAYDWAVNICAARSGPLGFLHTPLSVYRDHGGGQWSRMPPEERLRAQLGIIAQYDALTEHAYHAEFEALAAYLRGQLEAG